MEKFFYELLATLIGIFAGFLLALAADRYNEKRKNKLQASILLRSLEKELSENYNTIKNVRSDFISAPWGRSFYINTSAWDTALSSGDLPNIIGFELTDSLAEQYSYFIRSRYYVDLLTRLWFAPDNIQGYEEKRKVLTMPLLSPSTKL